jgi:hypothetical protein
MKFSPFGAVHNMLLADLDGELPEQFLFDMARQAWDEARQALSRSLLNRGK